MDALRSFETSFTIYQSTLRDIPEYLNFQQQNIFLFFHNQFCIIRKHNMISF
jgi:hypothetical protein